MNAKDLAFRGLTAFHRALMRISGGRIGSRLAGMLVVNLTTTGRKSGQPRVTTLTVPVVDGDRLILVASYGGDTRHPAWYLNLRDNPLVEIDRGNGPEPMTARTATPEEKAELWPRITKRYRGYAGYQRKTPRDIPVVIVTPR